MSTKRKTEARRIPYLEDKPERERGNDQLKLVHLGGFEQSSETAKAAFSLNLASEESETEFEDSPRTSSQALTKTAHPLFDFSSYPENTLFHERRIRLPVEPLERPAKRERRKRIDPCTFEKQYTTDETEFMNAMQDFKTRTGKPFPTYDDVLRIAFRLGYRKTGKTGPLPGGPTSPLEDE